VGTCHSRSDARSMASGGATVRSRGVTGDQRAWIVPTLLSSVGIIPQDELLLIKTAPWCGARRWQTGDMTSMSESIVTRFWSKVEKTDGCWLWRASVRADGYGQFAIRHGEIVLAHRFAYEAVHGPIPPGRQHCVCHTCDTPACVNPSHLWLGTPLDNVTDCISKERKAPPIRGEQHSGAKITDAQVNQIRRLYATGEYRQSVLGRMFNVNPGHISRIVNNKKRKEIKP
jgi:hypothetical protein